MLMVRGCGVGGAGSSGNKNWVKNDELFISLIETLTTKN